MAWREISQLRVETHLTSTSRRRVNLFLHLFSTVAGANVILAWRTSVRYLLLQHGKFLNWIQSVKKD